MSDICYTVLIINVLQIASVNGKFCLAKTFAFKKRIEFFAKQNMRI